MRPLSVYLRWGKIMMTFVIIGAIAGAVLGMRFRVLALIPAVLVATVVVVISSHGRHLLAIVLTALATTAALEVGYAVGALFGSKCRPIFRGERGTD